MANRNRKSNQRGQSTAPSGSPPRGRRVWLTGTLVIGISLAVWVVFSVDANRPTNSTRVSLPPLSMVIIDGARAAQIDVVALAEFAAQHQLPEVPDLSHVSAETAQDLYQAFVSIAERPHEAPPLGQLGRVYQSHQYPAQALACYSQARNVAAEAFEWPYYIGRMHADAYEFEQAIEAYESSAQLNASYAPTFLALGNLYSQTGKLAEARQAYRRFTSLRPKSTHGYLGLARIAFDNQEYEDAIDLLNDAITRNPQDFRVRNLLGQAHQQLGETEKAREHLAVVKNLDRRDQVTKHVLMDDPLYHKMLASNTTDTALTERMRAAMATGQTKVAIQLAEQLCQRHPNDATRMHSLAVAFKQAKRFNDALATAENAISLDSGFLEAHLTKAQLLMILHRHDEALRQLDWVVAQDPESFDGHYNRGAAQVLSKQYAAAVDSFREAVRLKDNSARAHVAFAEALGKTGRHAEATDEYRRALKLDPTNARAMQMLRN